MNPRTLICTHDHQFAPKGCFSIHLYLQFHKRNLGARCLGRRGEGAQVLELRAADLIPADKRDGEAVIFGGVAVIAGGELHVRRDLHREGELVKAVPDARLRADKRFLPALQHERKLVVRRRPPRARERQGTAPARAPAPERIAGCVSLRISSVHVSENSKSRNILRNVPAFAWMDKSGITGTFRTRPARPCRCARTKRPS